MADDIDMKAKHIPGQRREGESHAAWVSRTYRMGWVPASGGTERPILDMDGRRFLYCFDHKTREHAYINMDTDLPETPRLP